MPELEEDQPLSLNENLARLMRFIAKRRWWVFWPFVGVTLVTSAVLAILPNHYTSSATLLVVQQQVPQRYVVPNSTTDITSALQAMKQEVLSRTQLLRMINDFGLYPTQRKRLAPEQLVELMNRNIDITPISDGAQQNNKDFDAFKISFTTENALLAQQVTNNLTSLFINEYLRAGAEQATNTTNFLHQQVEDKGKELEAQEQRLRDFKMQHVGELPEQQQGNLGILTGLQTQLQNTMMSLDRAQQQRALLQAELAATPERRPTAQFGINTPLNAAAPQALSPIEAAQSELATLEAARSAQLSKGHTSEYPDVIAIDRDIARAQSKLKRLEAAAPAKTQTSAHGTAPSAAPAATDDPAVAQIKANLEANRVEIQNLTNDERRLKAQVAEYESRINATPVREQQEAGILRDTEVLRQQYSDLQKKEQESQLATNLEKQQGGQQFRLIDPPSLPVIPSSPKRAKLSVGGAAAGLALGFALALFMQMRDTSYYLERELTEDLSPPFVLGIPLLPTPWEERRRRWRNLFQWVAASAMLLVVCAAEFYVHKLG